MKINKEAQAVALLHSMVVDRLEEFRKTIKVQQLIIDRADCLHELFGLELRKLDKDVYDLERELRSVKVAISNIRVGLSTKKDEPRRKGKAQ